MADDAPAQLPLRMIVEWLYCPRLFHYMHVDGVMVANAHVWDGRQKHERADAPGTARVRRDVADDDAPTPDDDERPKTWRETRAVDVQLADPPLVGRLDGVMRDDAGAAIPTELKRGSGPDDGSTWVTHVPGVWDSDAVHVALQCLCLEAMGHRVPRGEIYYRASRTRVDVPWTDALRDVALRAVAGARAAQSATERPAPLVDSPKCRGCSLAETCMPDESNLLRRGLAMDPGDDDAPDASDAPAPRRARRLVAAKVEGRSLTVSTAGASVRKEKDALMLVPPPTAEGQRTVRVALDAVDALSVVGNVQVSTQALAACLEAGVSVSFHAGTGKLLGSVGVGLGNNVRLRATQHAWADDPARTASLAREFVRGKLRNQRVLLRRHSALSDAASGEFDSLLRALDAADDGDTLRGVEGRAARVYFDAYGALLATKGGPVFTMDGRTRRPPRDPVNAMLSFGYAVLARQCADVLHRVGFDPMRGYLHGMGWGRPALALDLMEEFRVLIVDSTVLRVIAEQRVGATDFHRELDAVTIKPNARRSFLQALDQRLDEDITHPVFGYKVSYRRALELQARVLARVLDGEAARYIALTTR